MTSLILKLCYGLESKNTNVKKLFQMRKLHWGINSRARVLIRFYDIINFIKVKALPLVAYARKRERWLFSDKIWSDAILSHTLKAFIFNAINFFDIRIVTTTKVPCKKRGFRIRILEMVKIIPKPWNSQWL